MDIDDATHSLYPNANRWDYAVEYDKETYFVEFHPASTGNVTEMAGKIAWLKDWLCNKAPLINDLKPTNRPAFLWVATGGIKILKGSVQARKLAVLGLLPRKTLEFR